MRLYSLFTLGRRPNPVKFPFLFHQSRATYGKKYQCRVSATFIPDPGSEFFHPGSPIQGQKGTGYRIRVRNREFKFF